MEAFLIGLIVFLETVVITGTHVLYATLGGMMCEKVGNLNLGLEGLMLLGGAFGFWAALVTGSPLAAVAVAALAGLLGALIYAFLTVSLKANQVVTGLALTIFGTGLSGMLGRTITGKQLPQSVSSVLGSHKIPYLSDIPVIGRIFFSQSWFIPSAFVLAFVLYFYYKHTRIGLNTRMIGENPGAADASGICVTRYKYINILIGGMLCGLGGGYFALTFSGTWQNQLTAGAGWIAVAMVIFATWDPRKAILGAYLFGAVRGIGFKMQSGLNLFGHKLAVSPAILDMLPYMITVVVLIVITIRKKREYQPPASLSIPYFREDR